MTATYHRADSENGDHIDDPAEEALFVLTGDLNTTGNTFVVIQPGEDDPSWSASAAVADDGGHEVVRRDTRRHGHEVMTSHDRGEIAQDPTIWMAARTCPGRPASTSTYF
ncbi:hypothetical protein ACWDUI_26110 [Streptosporangium sandarakinum]